jgi:AAA domain
MNAKVTDLHGNPIHKYDTFHEASDAADDGQVVATFEDGKHAPIDAEDAVIGALGVIAVSHDGKVLWPQFPSPPEPAPEPGEEFDDATLERLTDGFIWDDDSQIDPPDYLVKGLIPRRDVAFIGGQSGAGKTYIALLLATCLASGKPFFGRAIKEPVGVAILAAEGAGTYKMRLRVARERAIGKGYTLPITYLGTVPDLSDPKEVKALIPRLRAVNQKMMRDHGVRLGAVITDTVAAAFDLDDENDNSEAAKIIRSLKFLGGEVNALMIPIHHFGSDASRGLRGASGWTAGCDVILSVLADRDRATGHTRNRELALAKAREYPEGPVAPFTLHFMALGKDDDGDDFGSCYVEPQLGKPSILGNEVRQKPDPVSLVQFRAAFSEAIKKAGEEPLRRENGAEVKAVRLDDVRAAFNLTYAAAEESSEKRADKVRAAFNRAIKIAHTTGEFGFEVQSDIEWVWAASGPATVVIDLEAMKAKVESAHDPETGEVYESAAGIPFMMTRDMRERLGLRGFSKGGIDEMTPAEAHRILEPDAPDSPNSAD